MQEKANVWFNKINCHILLLLTSDLNHFSGTAMKIFINMARLAGDGSCLQLLKLVCGSITSTAVWHPPKFHESAAHLKLSDRVVIFICYISLLFAEMHSC